jgi:hypothetical protein
MRGGLAAQVLACTHKRGFETHLFRFPLPSSARLMTVPLPQLFVLLCLGVGSSSVHVEPANFSALISSDELYAQNSKEVFAHYVSAW